MFAQPTFAAESLIVRKYQQLVEATNTHATDYFPAYRLGEFK